MAFRVDSCSLKDGKGAIFCVGRGAQLQIKLLLI